MKAIVKPKLTNKEFRALKDEIRAQCVDETRKYEVLIDAVIFNQVAKEIGYDKEVLKRIYDRVYEAREKASKEYKLDGLSSDMAAFMELQKNGIDIMKWQTEKKSKFDVEMRRK